MAHVIDRRDYPTDDLLRAHPPRFVNAYKQKIHARAAATPARGTIGYRRLAPLDLPPRVPAAGPTFAVRTEPFDYGSSERGGWYVNFADPRLFVAYGSALLAQDELQVLEHPALGSLREALLAEGLPAVTEEAERPTPVLVTGVERRCALDTSPDLGRPFGLYGNRFASAPFHEVEAALTVLEPPTVSNVIAMAAPVGRGRYRRDQLEWILTTAYTAFEGAAAESRERWPGARVEISTGFWGCGAFGGNRTIMVLLQRLAARLAAIDELRFYTVDRAGLGDYEAGVAAEHGLGDDEVPALLERIAAQGHAWGESDGN
jgi:hypothetical protein